VAGLVALAAVALATGSSLSAPSGFTTQPARAVAAADHVAFVGVIDGRASGGFANLIGLLEVAVILVAAWALVADRTLPDPARSGYSLRRWRARLVGAPPVVS
jgi:hypothetical protein